MRTKILFGIFAILTVCVHAQKTKTLKKEGAYIEYPEDWLVRDVPGYLMLVSEPAGSELTIMSTFDIQVDANFKNIDAFWNNYKKKMSNSDTFKNFKVKSKNKILYKGFDAIELNCIATVNYLPLEWKSIVFQKGNKIYKLTTTSMITQFELLKEKTEKIFDSFKVE